MDNFLANEHFFFSSPAGLRQIMRFWTGWEEEDLVWSIM